MNNDVKITNENIIKYIYPNANHYYIKQIAANTHKLNISTICGDWKSYTISNSLTTILTITIQTDMNILSIIFI